MTYPRFSAENLTPDPEADAGTQHQSFSHRENLRVFADEFGMWLFCDRRACRRTRSCRGNPHICCASYGPLLPDGVKLWFLIFDDAKKRGLSFEEMLDEIENSPAAEAFTEWQSAAAISRDRPPRTRRDTAATDL